MFRLWDMKSYILKSNKGICIENGGFVMEELLRGLFDSDNDGEMNSYEKAVEFSFMDEIFGEEEEDDGDEIV